MEGAAAPSPADVRRIATLADPVIRNLEITQCYSRLAAAVAALTGGGANWCSFATWASRQAGCTIRGEDLGDRLRDIAQVAGECATRSVARGAHCFAADS